MKIHKYEMEIVGTRWRWWIKVRREKTPRPIGILELEMDECNSENEVVVHLPYVDPTLTTEEMGYIWGPIACQLPFSTYIAYIEDRPAVQRLAEELGFIREDRGWVYDLNLLERHNAKSR